MPDNDTLSEARKRVSEALGGLPESIFKRQEDPPAPSVPVAAPQPVQGEVASASIAQTLGNLEHFADRFDTVLGRLDAHRDRLGTLSDWLNHHTVG